MVKSQKEFMRKILSIVIVIVAAVVILSAQTRQDRRHHTEVITVVSKAQSNVNESDNEASYPDTSYSYPIEDFKPGVVRVGPRTTYLKEGLRTDEVIRLLGKPFSFYERNENGVATKVYLFQRGEGRVLIAEFVNEILVRSWIETRDNLVVQSDH